MTDEERPEWLQRCDAVNACSTEPHDKAKAEYLFWCLMATPFGVFILLGGAIYAVYSRVRGLLRG